MYLLGKNLELQKSVKYALTKIYGVGISKAFKLCKKLGISNNFKVYSLKSRYIKRLLKIIEKSNILLNNDLKKIQVFFFKKLIKLKTYKGLRKLKGLPVRGQRTRTNAKTAKHLKKNPGNIFKITMELFKYDYLNIWSLVLVRFQCYLMTSFKNTDKKIFNHLKKKYKVERSKFALPLAPFIQRTYRWNHHYLFALIDNHLIHYPTPINLNYAWSFGSSAGICLIIQIISGIFLAMHYTPHIDLAFSSVEHIMRDVNHGWLIRYIHANGASMFFIVVYCHIFRGLYYGSYMNPRQLLWCSGVVMFILMMGIAFMGYVLPWGQMSFWGATVITNLVTAIPVVGKTIVDWLWGGFTIGDATLKRFFSLHFTLPFILVALTLIHLALLHRDGSNNPLGVDANIDKIPFYPYFFVKDLFAFFCFLFVFSMFIFYFPNALGHPDNYIPADPMQTPAHIVPEWYFLPFYAILRSIPDKLGGVAAMVGSLLVLFTLPFINTSEIRSTTFRPIFKIFFWLFVADFFILGWVGQKPVKDVYITVGQIATTFYFLFFIFFVPVIGILESYLVHKKTT